MQAALNAPSQQIAYRYSDAEPRVPAGNSTGGQWTDGGIPSWQSELKTAASDKDEAKALAKKLDAEHKGDPEWKEFRGAVKDWQRSSEGADGLRGRLESVMTGKSADPSATALLRALNREPATAPSLFRGIAVSEDFDAVAAKYAKDTHFDIPMASFSTSKTIAHQFAEGGVDKGRNHWVVFTLKPGSRALPVENLSHNWQERERLSGGRFKVLSVEKRPPISHWVSKGYTEVTIEQVGVFNAK